MVTSLYRKNNERQRRQRQRRRKPKQNKTKEEAKVGGGEADKNVQGQATETGATADWYEAATSPATAEGQEVTVKKKDSSVRRFLVQRAPRRDEESGLKRERIHEPGVLPEGEARSMDLESKKVVLECQKHQDYPDSLRWLIEYSREYAGHVRYIIGE
ncbi:hypothetical protein K435DRAFT_860984 [Dendrothele bispora CBS 962.96]|uniref:HAM1-like N-terminal domain-containing protein n=1 Tax=Dendrothele bispora (strain CBS 962.96) TaxID=1314807 RepID=A0A4S8LX38_DENBC|nr:hypothetical protein K435DRAFT_860984 [Dendrothele bispora CBS 962.96]